MRLKIAAATMFLLGAVASLRAQGICEVQSPC